MANATYLLTDGLACFASVVSRSWGTDSMGDGKMGRGGREGGVLGPVDTPGCRVPQWSIVQHFYYSVFDYPNTSPHSLFTNAYVNE